MLKIYLESLLKECDLEILKIEKVESALTTC